MKCVAGCKAFTGGEIYHHKDCPFYAESLSKMYDDLKKKVSRLEQRVSLASAPKEAVLLAKISQHVSNCPIGWIDNKTIKFHSTTDLEIIKWLKKLNKLSKQSN